jgi:hypothetical protein
MTEACPCSCPCLPGSCTCLLTECCRFLSLASLNLSVRSLFYLSLPSLSGLPERWIDSGTTRQSPNCAPKILSLRPRSSVFRLSQIQWHIVKKQSMNVMAIWMEHAENSPERTEQKFGPHNLQTTPNHHKAPLLPPLPSFLSDLGTVWAVELAERAQHQRQSSEGTPARWTDGGGVWHFPWLGGVIRDPILNMVPTEVEHQ